jgi:pilus assembly protein Flp/PilA
MPYGKAILEGVNDESGQDLIEYALVAGIIAVGAVASISPLATTISRALSNIGSHLTKLCRLQRSSSAYRAWSMTVDNCAKRLSPANPIRCAPSAGGLCDASGADALGKRRYASTLLRQTSRQPSSQVSAAVSRRYVLKILAFR